eukprot:351505-Chlamydomonas_euryale.AAC.5
MQYRSRPATRRYPCHFQRQALSYKQRCGLSNTLPWIINGGTKVCLHRSTLPSRSRARQLVWTQHGCGRRRAGRAGNRGWGWGGGGWSGRPQQCGHV